jgi:hypothetical protein
MEYSFAHLPELAEETICFPVVRRHRRRNNWAWPLAI